MQLDKWAADMRAGKGIRTDTELDEAVQAEMLPLTEDPFNAEALEAAKAVLEQQISGELDRRRATIMRLALSTRKG